MSPKTKQNVYAMIFALLVFATLFLGARRMWPAALGTAFFALIIWNNKLRKSKDNQN